MATINFPDAWVPEAYELTGNMLECASIQNSIPLALNPTGQVVAAYTLVGRHPELRRKPVLIRVVLDVTGPKRKIVNGECYLDHFGEIRRWSCDGPSNDEYIPLSAPVRVTK